MFWDGRKWNTVRDMYSTYVNGLAPRGVELSHTFFRQSNQWIPLGLKNAGLNYFEASAAFNNWMARHWLAEKAVAGAAALGAANMVTAPLSSPPPTPCTK
jgi:hypothetical protein